MPFSRFWRISCIQWPLRKKGPANANRRTLSCKDKLSWQPVVVVDVAFGAAAGAVVGGGGAPLFISTLPPLAGSMVAFRVSWPFLISSLTSFLLVALRFASIWLVLVTPSNPFV